jgi:UDP-2,3-diacylglucosamine pyrophosphatase LpxH
MSTFRIISDLHLEFLKHYNAAKFTAEILPIMENEKNQTLLLAGDILTAKTVTEYSPFIDSLSKRFKHVVIIAGNHEHYYFVHTQTYSTLKEYYSQWENITLLENEDIVIDDVAIFGATLWTDFNNNDPMDKLYARQSMNDFMIIKDDNTFTFTPDKSVDLHKESLKHIEQFIKKYSNHKKIIMTHHAPSYISVSSKYKNSALNPAFFSNLDKLVESSGAEYWIHGHMHEFVRYKIGQTDVICNPSGYPNEKSLCRRNLVVDI